MFLLRDHEGDYLSRIDDEFDRWAERNQELFVALVAAIGLIRLQATYKLVNVHYAAALAIRFGVEVAGVIIAEQIDGQSGVQAWQRYSNRVFSVDDMGLIPDPFALIDIISESEAKIRKYYGIDKAVKTAIRTYNPTTIGGRGGIVKTGFSFAKKVYDRGLPSIRTFTI